MSAIASALVLSLAMLAATPEVLVTVYPIHHNERLRVCECGDWQGYEDWVARVSFVRRWQSHGAKIDSCGRSVNVGPIAPPPHTSPPTE